MNPTSKSKSKKICSLSAKVLKIVEKKKIYKLLLAILNKLSAQDFGEIDFESLLEY